MGMYNELHAINISHKNFDRAHNGLLYQTKDLDCDLSVYCVFNGQLYQKSDNSSSEALKIDYTGGINIYTINERNSVERWIEYDLIFNDGKLVDVAPYEVKVTKDNRDLSSFRPDKPSNRVEVTIGLSNCDRDKQDAFIKSLDDEKINAIRDILGEPTATVFYPVDASLGFGGAGLTSNIASVVQVVENFGQLKDGLGGKITAPNGDRITLIFDEASK